MPVERQQVSVLRSGRYYRSVDARQLTDQPAEQLMLPRQARQILAAVRRDPRPQPRRQRRDREDTQTGARFHDIGKSGDDATIVLDRRSGPCARRYGIEPFGGFEQGVARRLSRQHRGRPRLDGNPDYGESPLGGSRRVQSGSRSLHPNAPPPTASGATGHAVTASGSNRRSSSRTP